MIKIRLKNHTCFNEICDIVRLFYKKEQIILIEDSFDKSSDDIIINNNIEKNDKIICFSSIEHSDQYMEYSEEIDSSVQTEKIIKTLIKRSIYKLLSEYKKKQYPWGILTGIRPVKIVNDLIKKQYNDNVIIDILKNHYLISDDRISLMIDIAKRQQKHILKNNKKSISIYIGIPFCPTKCHYCSFASYSIASQSEYVSLYIDKLIIEMREVSKYLKQNNLNIQTVYIGGGTPTSLDASNFKKLLDAVCDFFTDGCIEFTCEAGRPDTIDHNKLELMKNAKVTRLSINPQTMNDVTLNTIGRFHTSKKIYEAYEMAKQYGFSNINMDIIIGLPGEEKKHLENTLNQIIKLNPKSITVHTLALKRASKMHENLDNYSCSDDSEVLQMMKLTRDYMDKHSYNPYYLYRQKFMKENLENIGFCKDGYECLYNINIMEENQTIVAFGADAVTKVIFFEENRIERQHNIKEYKLYMQSIDKMIEDKIKLISESIK